MKGQVYLKPLTKTQALSIIGVGISDIPYDDAATISPDSILRDVSPNNGSLTNTIGVAPTNVLNSGNPCVVDGTMDKSNVSSTGYPFHTWSN